MGSRTVHIPTCDGCGEDCPDGVTEETFTVGGEPGTVELGGTCHEEYRRVLGPLLEKAKKLRDSAIFLAGPDSEETGSPEDGAPGVLGTPEALREPEEAPAELHLISTHLTKEQRNTIREWWAKHKRARDEFGEPTTRGRLSQLLVDMYCQDMNRRAERSREPVRA